jgi:hypothetical protein
MKSDEFDLINALKETADAEEKNRKSSIKQCKICKEFKIKIPAGKRPDGRNTRFVGQDDLEWSGKTCPKCHVAKMKNHMAGKRHRG